MLGIWPTRVAKANFVTTFFCSLYLGLESDPLSGLFSQHSAAERLLLIVYFIGFFSSSFCLPRYKGELKLSRFLCPNMPISSFWDLLTLLFRAIFTYPKSIKSSWFYKEGSLICGVPEWGDFDILNDLFSLWDVAGLDLKFEKKLLCFALWPIYCLTILSRLREFVLEFLFFFEIEEDVLLCVLEIGLRRLPDV